MIFVFFFFQAEDGIRDHCVTGVQTCALPISWITARARLSLCSGNQSHSKGAVCPEGVRARQPSRFQCSSHLFVTLFPHPAYTNPPHSKHLPRDHSLGHAILKVTKVCTRPRKLL